MELGLQVSALGEAPHDGTNTPGGKTQQGSLQEIECNLGASCSASKKGRQRSNVRGGKERSPKQKESRGSWAEGCPAAQHQFSNWDTKPTHPCHLTC